jgi:hypothetical protein
MALIAELKRRNVIRAGIAYAVAAWLLIQVAETIFPLFGFDDTPARIVVIVLAIGFVPAMVLAWVFEWTPEGLRPDTKDEQRSVTVDKRMDRWIMAGLAVAVGYFAIDKFVLEPQREAIELESQAEQLSAATEEARVAGRTDALIESFGDQSIAVLPFADMSPAGDQEYFSDGIADHRDREAAQCQSRAGRLGSQGRQHSQDHCPTHRRKIRHAPVVGHLGQGSG